MQELCNPSEFLSRYGFKDLDERIFLAAFTHPSYSFEHGLSENESYERLEFLGDAVLKLVMSKMLFEKFPNYQEGKMTNIRAILVSDDFLYHLAEDMELKKYIRISTALEKDGGRNTSSISACVFEAILGALFESNVSLERIYEYLDKLYSKYLNDVKNFLPKFNSKALLQEYTQGKNKDLPKYEQTDCTGAENNCEFTVKVTYHGEELGIGKGKSKKAAEKEAAYKACLKLNITGE